MRSNVLAITLCLALPAVSISADAQPAGGKAKVHAPRLLTTKTVKRTRAMTKPKSPRKYMPLPRLSRGQQARMLNSSTSALGKTISLTPKNVYDPAGFKLVLSTLGNGDLFFDPSSNAIDLHGVNALASIEIQRPAGQKLLLECFVSHSFSSSAGSGSGATPTVTITASASTSGADQTASPPANQVYNFPVIITTKAGWNQVTFSSAGFWHFHGCDITPMN